MYFRLKQSGSCQHLQIVKNRREDVASRQRVIETLGRPDELEASGALAGLLRSGARFADAVAVLTAQANGVAPTAETQIIGPPVIFERLQKDAGDRVLSRPGRYQVVRPERQHVKEPSPLMVKEVWLEERRYVVCLNEEQARKGAHDREAILGNLWEQLRQGDRSRVGNQGYRSFLCREGEGFVLDPQRTADEARYDGKWVLATNTNLAAAELAPKHQQLWLVEEVFRTTRSLLHTRPVFDRRDGTIRGHVFCSFLALLLRTTLRTGWRRPGMDSSGPTSCTTSTGSNRSASSCRQPSGRWLATRQLMDGLNPQRRALRPRCRSWGHAPFLPS